MGLSQEEHRLGQPFFRNDRRKRSLQYAQIIIDISTQALDRIFTYRIPEELSGKANPIWPGQPGADGIRDGTD